MNPAFTRILSASAEDRLGLFAATARRLNSNVRNVEKDFWVCWTLDVLFNDLPGDRPRLLFKGGTSLSKAFNLISRFSEDIDVTVFRDDLDQPASIEELEALGTKKRDARLDAIRAACEAYINGDLLRELRAILGQALAAAGFPPDAGRIVPAANDSQTLLLWYPSVARSQGGDYVEAAVRIESGAKSALDPNAPAVVRPYVAEDLDDPAFAVPNVTTVDPRRTFWDKVVILHGLRSWYDNRGELRQEGQRITRHYYDIHRLLASDVGRDALADRAMGIDCARHARIFFNRPPFNLASAVAGGFSISPAPGMIEPLRRDYDKMAGMIFGAVPPFEAVLASIEGLQADLGTS